MKKTFLQKAIYIFGLFLICGMTMFLPNQGKKASAKWIQGEGDGWSNDNGGHIYYVEGNTLYVTKDKYFYENDIIDSKKICSWKLKSGDTLSLNGAKGNYLFPLISNGNTRTCYSVQIKTKKRITVGSIQIKNGYLSTYAIKGHHMYLSDNEEDAGKATLYIANYAKKQKIITINDCNPSELSGKYIIGETEVGGGTDGLTMCIWKVSGTKAKKIKTLGKRVWPVGLYQGKYYYISYKDIAQTKADICCCKVNGTGTKKLFSVNAGTGGQISPEYENKMQKTGKVVISVLCNGKTTLYEYTIKTGKLKKKKQ